VGDKETTADALRIIDWAKMDLGQLQEPVNWQRALLLFEEVGDLPGQAGVLNMLGGFAYFKGDWDEAVALYRRAQATARRTGNAVMDAFYVFNIGEIALEQGRLDEAEEAFVAVNRTWRAAGYRSGAADAKGKLARVYGARALRRSAGALCVLHWGDGRHREPGGRTRSERPHGRVPVAQR
jgi:tetratricopeptide (TPR) repeat protein